MPGRSLRARSGRANRSDLADFVQSLPTPKTLLGLTHLTSSYVLRDVLETGQISAEEPCPIIGEKVVYAFYGRASFRGTHEFEPTSLVSLFPCVFILDPLRVPQPSYVFGFDSGAFVEGRMDEYLHPYMPLFDFLLAPEVEAAAKIVNALFDSPDDYFQNRPSLALSAPSSNFEADCYLQMVRSGGQSQQRLDDRVSTPEFLFRETIRLRDCVRAAVIPDSLSSDKVTREHLKTYGVKILDYPWVSCSRPAENHFVVRGIVQGFYKDMGWA